MAGADANVKFLLPGSSLLWCRKSWRQETIDMATGRKAGRYLRVSLRKGEGQEFPA